MLLCDRQQRSIAIGVTIKKGIGALLINGMNQLFSEVTKLTILG
ncbi:MULTISPECIES: hypothetical protein [unclassified Microcoleus]